MDALLVNQLFTMTKQMTFCWQFEIQMKMLNHHFWHLLTNFTCEKHRPEWLSHAFKITFLNNFTSHAKKPWFSILCGTSGDPCKPVHTSFLMASTRTFQQQQFSIWMAINNSHTQNLKNCLFECPMGTKVKNENVKMTMTVPPQVQESNISWCHETSLVHNLDTLIPHWHQCDCEAEEHGDQTQKLQLGSLKQSSGAIHTDGCTVLLGTPLLHHSTEC